MKFDPNKGHSVQYVSDHISRIEGQHAGNQNLILDSMWRIASHCDLPGLGNELSPEQVNVVERFIADFKASHHRVIENYRRSYASPKA